MGDVVEQRLARQREDVVLQLLEVVDAGNFLASIRVGEYEVAKAEILSHHVAQIHIHLLRVLVDEVVAAALGTFGILGLGTVHDERNVWVVVADGTKELEAGKLVFLLFRRASTLDRSHWKTAVADHAERVLAVAAIQAPCFFVVAGKHDLRAATHAECLKGGIERLGRKFETLLEHELIEVGQNGAVEADIVLHQENHLHACFHVMLKVHLVLDQLDDGQEQVGIAEPAEHIFKD